MRAIAAALVLLALSAPLGAQANDPAETARQWSFRSDANGDGKVTVTDVRAWGAWLFYYPGDLAIRQMLGMPVTS